MATRAIPTWLQKQRKQDLLDLSAEAGLQQNPDLRRDELIQDLHEYLQQHAPRLGSNATFEPYYGTRGARARTPGRPPRESAYAGALTSGEEGEVKSVVRGRGRRSTKGKQELESGHAALSSPTQTLRTSLIARRPSGGPVLRRRSSLPPSPAYVSNVIEHQEAKLYAGLTDLYTVSGVPETVDWLRDACSTVVGVQGTFLLVEAYALQSQLLRWKYTGYDMPSVATLGIPSVAVKVPDLFILLSGYFWSTTLLWTATSVAIPALFAYFYNLTTRTMKRHGAIVNVVRYEYDPLTFNIVKALLTWVVYGKGVSFGVFDESVAFAVNGAMFGGYNGILIGCYVVMLASLYEAAQRK